MSDVEVARDGRYYLLFGSVKIIDPANKEIRGAAPITQDPLIPIMAATPVMLLERIPTQSFSFPLLTNTTKTRFTKAIAIKPNKIVATKAASDSISNLPFQ
jgi:hypothetical protein